MTKNIEQFKIKFIEIKRLSVQNCILLTVFKNPRNKCFEISKVFCNGSKKKLVERLSSEGLIIEKKSHGNWSN